MILRVVGVDSKQSVALYPYGSVHDNEAYYQLRTEEFDIPAEIRPFVELPANTPKRQASFLREQSCTLESGEGAATCRTCIDATALDRLTSKVALIDYTEASANPLIRYWRWPSGARSAVCVPRDLDALTLLDHVSGLFVR